MGVISSEEVPWVGHCRRSHGGSSLEGVPRGVTSSGCARQPHVGLGGLTPHVGISLGGYEVPTWGPRGDLVTPPPVGIG